MGKHLPRHGRTPAPSVATVASSTASPGGKGVVTPPPRRGLGEVIQNLLASLVLGVIALLAYANSFTSGLVLDNSVVIAGDERIQLAKFDAQTWENIKNIFRHNYWWPAFESNLYRPLTTLSYWFNYAVLGSGEHVASYHIVNFLLHWLNIILVLVIVRRLSGRLELAWLTAGIFAVHPINVEAVTNIVGRADLLATLAILLGGWFYLKAAEATGWRRALWMAGAVFNAFWGIFAKESAIIIICFVFLYDMVWRWPRLAGPSWWERTQQAFWEFFLKGWLPILVPVLTFVGVYFYHKYYSPVFGEIFADNPIVGANSWFAGRMTAFSVLGRYLALMVFPRQLSSDYSYNQIPLYGSGSAAGDAEAWAGLAAVAGLLGLAFWLRRRQPLLSWGIFLFFLAQILTCNVFFNIGSIMGERFEYLPSVGFAVVAAQLLWWIGGAISRWRAPKWLTQTAAAGVLAVALMAALGVRTFMRNFDWQDDQSLWASTVQAVPGSFKAYKGYANSYLYGVLNQHTGDTMREEQATDEAIKIAEKGLSILDHPPLPINIQDNTLYQDLGKYYRMKGEYLAQRGKNLEARQYYQKSLDTLFRARDVDHWVNQASRASQLKRGRRAEDIADVGNQTIYILLFLTYEQLGDWKNAEAAGAYVVRLIPTQPMGYRMVAEAYDKQGRPGEAAVEILQGLLLNMRDANCWNALIGYYHEMKLQPFPITPLPDTYSLNDQIPLVRQELNQAGVQVVQRLEEGKLFSDADFLKKNLIEKIHIPADLFKNE